MSAAHSVSDGAQTQYLQSFSGSGFGADATGDLVSFSVTGGVSFGTSPIGVSGGSIWVDTGAISLLRVPESCCKHYYR